MIAVIYLDSCIVIYLAEGPDEYRKTCEQLLIAQLQDEKQLAITELTRMECRVAPLQKGQQDILNLYEDFFSLPQVIHLELSTAVFELATGLRAKQNLKIADTLHLAAAIQHGCAEFWTNDLRLQTAAAERLRIVNPFVIGKG